MKVIEFFNKRGTKKMYAESRWISHVAVSQIVNRYKRWENTDIKKDLDIIDFFSALHWKKYTYLDLFEKDV